MDEGDVGVARRLYEGFNDHDLEGIAALLDADVRWSTPASVPFGGLVAGVDAVRAYLTDCWAFFTRHEMVPERFYGGGGTVVVAGRHVAVSADGESHEVPFRHVLRMAAGRIAAYREQLDAGLVVRWVAGELSLAEPEAGRVLVD